MTMAPQRHPDRPRPGSARERAIPIGPMAETELVVVPNPSPTTPIAGFRASESEHRAAVARLARSHPPGRAAKSP